MSDSCSINKHECIFFEKNVNFFIVLKKNPHRIHTPMKNISLITIGALALTGVAASAVETSASAGYHSRYLFRGIDFAAQENAMADFGLDVTDSCDCGFDWYIGTWYGATTNGSPYNETDVYGGITKDFGFGSLDLGFITYTYDDGTQNDSEAYIGLSTGFAGLELGSTTYIGTGGSWKNGVYQELTASYGQEVNDAFSLALDLGLGFAFGQAAYGPDVDGLANYSATLTGNLAISENATLSPYVSYIQNNEAWNRDTVDGFVGGVKLAFTF